MLKIGVVQGIEILAVGFVVQKERFLIDMAIIAAKHIIIVIVTSIKQR